MKKISLLFITATLIGTVQAQTTRKTVKPAATQPTAPVAAAKPAPQALPKTNSFQVKGTNLLNVGIGVGTYYVGLPFGVSFEHGFSKDISGGVFVDYSSHNYGDNAKLHIIYAGIRASYHFGELLKLKDSKFDPYAGASLGYHHVSWNADGVSLMHTPYDNAVFFGVHAGARYLLSQHVGGFAEIGYGVAALKLGVTFIF